MKNAEITQIIANIKLLILDVDGVLTDGTVYLTDDGIEIKSFNILDGIGIKMLLRSGVDIAIVTGSNSNAIKIRADRLGIKYVYLNQDNKFSAFNDLKNKLSLQNHEIAYMGDDLPDLYIMRQVGLSIAVANATQLVLDAAKIITKNKGGYGAVREICELILQEQGNFADQLEYFDN